MPDKATALMVLDNLDRNGFRESYLRCVKHGKNCVLKRRIVFQHFHIQAFFFGRAGGDFAAVTLKVPVIAQILSDFFRLRLRFFVGDGLRTSAGQAKT